MERSAAIERRQGEKEKERESERERSRERTGRRVYSQAVNQRLAFGFWRRLILVRM